ncbi:MULTISPECIES: cell division protein FtsQ/DivIB [Halomonadaceae]|mgnify:FL=1|uniref:Cell division protein FtsQ n=1 Tax=Vreelandella halophila TaxID=86177 RepID=A0A9X4YCH1_9GAMM|nr:MULTISPECIES: cell division protein FtsQ/DivIB [Halomonas]MYL26655.1 FtsQ-type POTRA domain-containing protein [Halomonas utahensis]MYL73992.1 FtsQ-type POTRA domain-containing protein [Halomonas sp. 22501_18_FS]
MNGLLSPLRIRDTRAKTARQRGASPMVEDPSALRLALRMAAGAVRRVPWSQVSLGLVVAVTAAMLPWAIGQGVQFLDQDFNRVQVQGELTRVTEPALQNHLEPFIGTSYFATDLSRVKAQLEMLPWVESAAVGREWPGTLTVSVREHEPVALWNGQALISGEGTVFRPAAPAALDLPRLNGPAGRADEVLERARAFRGELAALGLGLESVSLEPRGAWTLLLDNGISVSLGRDRVRERFERFMTVYESRLSPVAADITGVDARYGNGVAVRWRDS